MPSNAPAALEPEDTCQAPGTALQRDFLPGDLRGNAGETQLNSISLNLWKREVWPLHEKVAFSPSGRHTTS